jgi:CP family cyanate transporter-like MFS transporter
VIGVGAGLRAVAGAAGLYSGAILAGVGIAVAGMLLPSLVRTRFPDRVGPVTGVYTAALIGGALLAAGATEPLRQALRLSPQATLALWSVPAAVALVAWLLLPRVPRLQLPARVSLPWRSRAAWLGALFMGGQSLLFYATLAWLAAAYTSLGRSASYAGLVLAVFSATQVITALAMPALAHRGGDVRPWIALSVGVTTLGLGLVAFAPAGFATQHPRRCRAVDLGKPARPRHGRQPCPRPTGTDAERAHAAGGIGIHGDGFLRRLPDGVGWSCGGGGAARRDR